MYFVTNPLGNNPSIVRGRLNENGAALVISLMFVAILAMLGTTAVLMTTTDMQIGRNYKESTGAFFDAQAGVNYAVGKMEAKLADGTFSLPTSPGDPTDANDSNSRHIETDTSFNPPSGFNFSYQAPGVTMIHQDKDIFTFTAVGADSSNNDSSSTTINVKFGRKSAITMGMFGEELVEVKHSANVYSYSHSSTPNPTPADSTGEGDVGSNESVVLKNDSFVDGDVGLGEDASGTDATLTQYSGAVYSEEVDMDRVNVDPLGLGILGGAYATKCTNCRDTNDNDCNRNWATKGCATRYVFGGDDDIEDDVANDNNEINLGNSEILTLKGKAAGANYYLTDIDLGNSATLYIDTTNGPVNIFLTGGLQAGNGSNIINSGAPSDFSLFANSQTDTIEIKNSAGFHGLIYAPYMTVNLKNSGSIYGAVIGNRVVMHNSSDCYFDTDLMDNGPPSNDLRVLAFENVYN